MFFFLRRAGPFFKFGGPVGRSRWCTVSTRTVSSQLGPYNTCSYSYARVTGLQLLELTITCAWKRTPRMMVQRTVNREMNWSVGRSSVGRSVGCSVGRVDRSVGRPQTPASNADRHVDRHAHQHRHGLEMDMHTDTDRDRQRQRQRPTEIR